MQARGGRTTAARSEDADGFPLWFVAAYDTHIVYRVLFYQRNETIYVLDVLVFPNDTGEG